MTKHPKESGPDLYCRLSPKWTIKSDVFGGKAITEPVKLAQGVPGINGHHPLAPRIAFTSSLMQTSQLTIWVCSEILRHLIRTKFRYLSTVTSSYYINKRQNMAWRKLIINNRQKRWDKNYAQYPAGTRTIGHSRIARAVRGQKFTHDINFIRPLTQDGQVVDILHPGVGCEHNLLCS